MSETNELAPGISLRAQNRATDPDDIKRLNRVAFAPDQGSKDFDELRRKAGDVLSLVAEIKDSVIGHVFFCPVSVSTGQGKIWGMGLGELAVHPGYQNQGIGSALTLRGLAELRQRACPFAIVIGHATYYPRFGFVPGDQHGLQCQWPTVLGPSFMVKILDEKAMQDVTGTASYRDI